MLSLVGLLASVAMLATACGGDDNQLDQTDGGNADGGDKGKVVIASAGFTEIQLMAEMYKLLLDKAGYSSSIKVVTNREVYEPALEKGEVDVVPDYAATMTEFLNVKANGPEAKPVATNDKDQTVDALNQLAEPLGLKALEAAEAVDQNAWIATKEVAAEKGATLSEWEGESIVLAATEECPDRPFCLPGLEKNYGIKVTENLPLGFGSAQNKEAVTSGKAQLGLTGTTDATLEDLGLVIIEDDKNVQLADNLVPVVGKKYANDTEFADALNALSSELTTEDLTGLNKKVDGERQKPADVAKEFLESKGLL
ncbi:MAG: ABC transporter substrate-binding protein [Actinomycetes bacterium]